MTISTDLQVGLVGLRSTKDQLLRSLYEYKDLRDDTPKATMFTLLNNFIESLSFLKSEIEFEYGIKLDDRLRSTNPEVLQCVMDYSELDDFLTNFKRNIVTKQLELKATELSNFKEQKQAKFQVTTASDDVVPELKTEKENYESMTTDAKVMSTTKKITARLTQSSQLLQTSLMQSQLNLEELDIQDEEIRLLSEKYGYMGSLLSKSDEYVRDIKTSAERERKLMFVALAFFAFAVSWVVYTRVLKWPLRILFFFVWTGLRPLFFVLGLFGKSKQEISETVTSSPIQTTTSTTVEERETVSFESLFHSGLVESLESLESQIEKISTTVSQATGVETSDDFDAALGRIIDEL